MPVAQAIQHFDEAVLRVLRGTPGWAVQVFVVFTLIGAGWGLFLFVPFLLWARTRIDAFFVVLTAGTTNSVVSLLKGWFGRVRPCETLGWCTALTIASPGGWSFPSGHAAGSFAVATFVALRARAYTDKPWVVALVMYVYAVLVALSRPVLGVHYPSDIVAGAALGSAIGWGFAAFVGYAHHTWAIPKSRLGRFRQRLRDRRGVRQTGTAIEARSPGGSDRDDPDRNPG
ncbi:MAG: phosphatase PAP2 family protein [Polyangiaceae bacterium]